MFCISCGQKVDEGVAQQPIQQQVMRPAPQVAPQNVSQSQNNKLIWVIIGVAAAFLIVAIVFGILILGKLGDNDKDDDDKISPLQSPANILTRLN